MIGDRLATARKKKGLTQIELAEALGGRYNQQMISHVERDRSTLRVDGLVNAAKVLNVSTDYLLGFTDDPTSADDRLSLAAKTQLAALKASVLSFEESSSNERTSSPTMPEYSTSAAIPCSRPCPTARQF